MPEHTKLIDELVTMGDYVRWGASRFNEAGLYFGHGSDNAPDEAFHLVCHALHLPHEIPAYMIETRLTREERQAVLELLQLRLETRQPSPYLTHEAWFAGSSFYVDERVLIPRSPIAELIEAQYSPWIDPVRVHSILDLCTGCGCIAITSALAFPDAHVDASDLSKEALEVARLNTARHYVEDRVSLIHGDLFQGLEGRVYDIIVSNPPYVDAEDMATLPEEYHHEPRFALAAGQDGLDVVRRILAQAVDYLQEEGILIVEVGNSAAALMEAFPNVPFTWLEFQHGGHGVFLMTAEHLQECRGIFSTARP